VGGLSPNTVFGKKLLHCQFEMGRSIIVQQEPAALCPKLWPHPANAFQQYSDNLNVQNTIDSLPFRHRFFMNRTLFVKKYDQNGFDLVFLQTKLFGPW
jgi:hypothetical protein